MRLREHHNRATAVAAVVPASVAQGLPASRRGARSLVAVAALLAATASLSVVGAIGGFSPGAHPEPNVRGMQLDQRVLVDVASTGLPSEGRAARLIARQDQPLGVLMPRSAVSPSVSAPPAHHQFEWQIGVDAQDGRALYEAWAGWLRTQDRSPRNVHTLAIALDGRSSALRADVAVAAMTAGDPDAVGEAMSGASLSDVDVVALGQRLADVDAGIRDRILASAAANAPGAFMQSLVDLRQAGGLAYLAEAREATQGCAAATPCGWLYVLNTLGPTVLDAGVARASKDASACGMPKTTNDLRALLNADAAMPWCLTRS